MAGFALLGGWTVGRNVIETMGGRIVPSGQFTLAASLAVSATMIVVGLGWGRATRTTTVRDAVRKEPEEAEVPREGEVGSLVGALQADAPGDGVTPIGEEETEELAANDLFDPARTGRVIMLGVLTPLSRRFCPFCCSSSLQSEPVKTATSNS